MNERMNVMEILKKVANRLLTIKSLVTIALCIVFCVLALTKVISGEQFLTIFTVVIGFYFGSQSEKKGSDSQ
jgi:F0F1-type ATP synthase assembly protein I